MSVYRMRCTQLASCDSLRCATGAPIMRPMSHVCRTPFNPVTVSTPPIKVVVIVELVVPVEIVVVVEVGLVGVVRCCPSSVRSIAMALMRHA